MDLSPEALARATPAARDRYVDFLRAFSIVAVVLGHWSIALIHWEGGRIFVQNAVGHQSGLWLATWVLQVMPLFFGNPPR
jgi:fucose 4-O-acetylase-like acetyltransferase